ncbi:tRNA pseudouridine(55) synthase TruB [Candidatus Uhrbacteria bacterium]|nr:MAG: tRNA pseudouridine(55) synthase TruB [Candidatus Uhrbacteria bacterium]
MDGLLLIDKPAGWTSHDVVAKLRGILKIRRIGHAGTLDPFATGLLILGIGKGTKKLTALVGLDKEYEATIRLGASSDTFDVEGLITQIIPSEQREPRDPFEVIPPLPPVGRDDIEEALARFRGGYEQLAPLHSAKKIGGKKLYDLARTGKATEEMRPKKFVKVYRLQITDYRWPDLKINVKCSSGTYIRSLADDIGRALGVGGYCLELRRTKIGGYDVRDALQIDGLTKDQALGSLKTQ